jgi:hypothetical protein
MSYHFWFRLLLLDLWYLLSSASVNFGIFDFGTYFILIQLTLASYSA